MTERHATGAANVYDRAADANRYDAARDLPPATMELWLAALDRYIPHRANHRILDLGCGTGRFSIPLSNHFGAHVVGIDPSQAMLDVAARRADDRVIWLLGDAHVILLPDASVDTVFMSQVLHHVGDLPTAMAEIRRVLRPGGLLVIRNGTTENLDVALWIDCFPDARTIEYARQPCRQELISRVCAASFRLVACESIEQVFAESFAEYCDKIGQRGLSSLLSISDDSFSSGMQRLRALTTDADAPVIEPVDLFVFAPA